MKFLIRRVLRSERLQLYYESCLVLHKQANLLSSFCSENIQFPNRAKPLLCKKGHRVKAGYGVFFFFIVLIYFPAKLTKVCRYKDFYLFIFPSANIIVRAKALHIAKNFHFLLGVFKSFCPYRAPG